jgi:hypothetical protein
MELAPIPNLIPMRVSAPSAASPNVPTTRAIDFRRQQDEDDATYTPSGSEDENRHAGDESHPSPEALEVAPDAGLAAPDELTSQRTISLFA